MSTQSKPELQVESITEEAVEEFLTAHPDFFNGREELLADLEISHDCGDASSFIEKQVKILKGQSLSYKSKLMELVQVARDNDGLNERIHRLTLALVDEPDIENIIATLQNSLYDDFAIDAVSVRIWNKDNNLIAECVHNIPQQNTSIPLILKSFLDKERPICGELTPEQVIALFNEDKIKIQSSALLPLHLSEGKGIIALGSIDKERFHSSLGKLFLDYLAHLIAKLINNKLRQ